MDANGHAATPLSADLALWIDSSASFDAIEIAGGADGTNWLVQAAGLLDGITFMPYERGIEALINSSVSAEVLCLLKYESRPAPRNEHRSVPQRRRAF